MTHSSIPSITRYLDVSLFLLIASGFATLAATRQLDAPSVILVSAALLVRGFQLLRGRSRALSEQVTALVTIAYVAFYVADLFLISGKFVTATVHLVLFSIVVKIFSLRRDRDRLYMAVLAFLAVLAAAVLTVDSLFLAAFCVFLLLAIVSFIAFEMKRSAEHAHTVSGRDLPQVVRPLSVAAFVLLVSIGLGGAGVFFVLPRFSGGYLSVYAPHNDLVSGFSDSVQLGKIGEIQQSGLVIMHIQIDGDHSGTHDLKWRGIALDKFNGERWTNTQRPHELYPSPDGAFALAPFPLSMPQPSQLIRYRVLMEPIGTNIFFLSPKAYRVSGAYRRISTDQNGTVYDDDPGHTITSYRAISYLEQPGATSASSASPEFPRPDPYLHLPPMDPRIRQFALKVTAPAVTAYGKAALLERHLRTSYGYTLELPRTTPRDPIADFLFVRKKGHCEYFASALAITLRTLGIPSRVVNGFRGGEFNSLTGSYIVRARDAHSWVEAYFPQQGWVSFDPTPADVHPGATMWTQALLYIDAMHEFWREWVINYDFSHQQALAMSTAEGARRTIEQWRRHWTARYQRWLVVIAQFHNRASETPQRIGVLVVSPVLLVLLALGFPRISRSWRQRALARHPEQAPQAAATFWYTRMTRALSRRGYRKLPSQTPAEFAAAIQTESLRRSIILFGERYERARFGNSAEDAQALPELYEELRRN